MSLALPSMCVGWSLSPHQHINECNSVFRVAGFCFGWKDHNALPLALKDRTSSRAQLRQSLKSDASHVMLTASGGSGRPSVIRSHRQQSNERAAAAATHLHRRIDATGTWIVEDGCGVVRRDRLAY